MSPQATLEIPPRSPYVGVVRLALASLARNAGLDEESVEDLRIAVGEACANSVIANEESSSQENVLVAFTHENGTVTVEISDRAGSVDQLAGESEDSQGFSSRLMMSVALLESLVDECEFVPRDGGGLTTRLVLRR